MVFHTSKSAPAIRMPMAIVSDDSTSAPIAADNDREDTAEFFQENDRSVTSRCSHGDLSFGPIFQSDP